MVQSLYIKKTQYDLSDQTVRHPKSVNAFFDQSRLIENSTKQYKHDNQHAMIIMNSNDLVFTGECIYFEK